MTPHIARRAGIPPFHVMDVWLAAAERQRSHGDLVRGEIGDRTLDPILTAAHGIECRS